MRFKLRWPFGRKRKTSEELSHANTPMHAASHLRKQKLKHFKFNVVKLWLENIKKNFPQHVENRKTLIYATDQKLVFLNKRLSSKEARASFLVRADIRNQIGTVYQRFIESFPEFCVVDPNTYKKFLTDRYHEAQQDCKNIDDVLNSPGQTTFDLSSDRIKFLAQLHSAWTRFTHFKILLQSIGGL